MLEPSPRHFLESFRHCSTLALNPLPPPPPLYPLSRQAGEFAAARAIFARLVTLKLSGKAVKGVFKKWLAFEKQHGKPKDEQAVKDEARAYVQRALESER